MAGGPDGLATGPPDDFEAIGRAFAELQGDGQALLPWRYVVWSGPASSDEVLAQVDQLAAVGIPLDLVLCYRDPGGAVAEWTRFVAEVVTRHGRALAAARPACSHSASVGSRYPSACGPHSTCSD
jgi:hypothetical protein